MHWRRLLVALIISTTGFASLAFAGGVQEIREAPEQWSVPAPVPGDSGTYYVIHVRDTEDGPVQVGETLPLFKFRAEKIVTHDALGQPHNAFLMRVDRAHYGNYQLSSHDWEFRDSDLSTFSLDEHRKLQYGIGFQGSGIQPEWTLPDLVERHTADEGSLTIFMDLTSDYWGGSVCPVIHRMQGQTFRTDRVEPFMECSFGANRVDPERTTGLSHSAWENLTSDSPDFYGDPFTALGVVTMNGTETLVLEQDGPAQEWGGTMRVWVQQDNPYVVRAEETVPGPNGLRRIWILDDYERGGPVQAAVLPDAAPEIQTRPAEAWGPDEAGWSQWLPSEAHAALAESDEQAWLDARPDAFLVSASWSHWEDEDDGWRSQTWAFGYRSGNDTANFEVTRREEAPAEMLPFELGDDVPGTAPGVTVVRGELTFSPVPEEPVDAWPTLVSVLARNEAMGGDGSLRDVSFVAGRSYQIGLGDLRDEVVIEGGIAERQSFDFYATFWAWNGTRDASIHSTGITTRATGSPVVQEEAPVPAADVAWGMPPTRWVAATGSGMALLGLIIYFWPHLKAGVLGLFTRIRPDAILEHPVRRHMVDIIEAQPGIHAQGLVRALDTGYGNVQHHVDKLLAAGKIVSKQSAGYVCYYLKGTDRRVVAAGPALRSDTARSLLAEVLRSPGASGGQLASAVGINRGTVSHHVQRLVEAGLLDGRRDGRAIRYWPTDVAQMVAAAS